MTEEQIAKEYTNKFYGETRKVVEVGDAYEIIKWLLHDHLIVEKSKVLEDYQSANEMLGDKYSEDMDKNNAIIIKVILEDYFGEETFRSTEE